MMIKIIVGIDLSSSLIGLHLGQGAEDGHLSTLIIPAVLTKAISECVNTFLSEFEHPVVDMDRVLNDIVEIVHTQIALSTSDKYRVPPLVLMRFARGGKTFTISKTFDKLKEQGRVSPILISFNGSGEQAFRRREGETQSEAILRLIAAQLSDYSVVDARQLVADRAVLDVCLGDNVVLLIDELNNLGTALDAEAAELLRTMFLDRPGRFLAFTSHVPVSIEPDLQLAKASSFIGSSSVIPVSLRGVSIVNMSSANSLNDLRSMSRACEELTEEQAAWLGYIPSLIYCTMNDKGRLGAVSPKQRFQQM